MFEGFSNKELNLSLSEAKNVLRSKGYKRVEIDPRTGFPPDIAWQRFIKPLRMIMPYYGILMFT